MKRILVLNGPNLDMLGTREPGVYGAQTLDDLEQLVQMHGRRHGVEVDCYQSNSEGKLIKQIHAAEDRYDGIVYNPGAHTHYSYALRDALASVDVPCVEVHISDIDAREPFRRVSVIAPACVAQVKGRGFRGYCDAMDLVLEGRTERLGEGFERRCAPGQVVLPGSGQPGEVSAVAEPIDDIDDAMVIEMDGEVVEAVPVPATAAPVAGAAVGAVAGAAAGAAAAGAGARPAPAAAPAAAAPAAAAPSAAKAASAKAAAPADAKNAPATDAPKKSAAKGNTELRDDARLPSNIARSIHMMRIGVTSADCRQPHASARRLTQLRNAFTARGLDGFFMRSTSNIEWLTAFDGVFDDEEAHAMLVTPAQAVLHTDSRYADAAHEAATAEGAVTVNDTRETHAAFVAHALRGEAPDATDPSPLRAQAAVASPGPGTYAPERCGSRPARVMGTFAPDDPVLPADFSMPPDSDVTVAFTYPMESGTVSYASSRRDGSVDAPTLASVINASSVAAASAAAAAAAAEPVYAEATIIDPSAPFGTVDPSSPFGAVTSGVSYDFSMPVEVSAPSPFPTPTMPVDAVVTGFSASAPASAAEYGMPYTYAPGEVSAPMGAVAATPGTPASVPASAGAPATAQAAPFVAPAPAAAPTPASAPAAAPASAAAPTPAPTGFAAPSGFPADPTLATAAPGTEAAVAAAGTPTDPAAEAAGSSFDFSAFVGSMAQPAAEATVAAGAPFGADTAVGMSDQGAAPGQAVAAPDASGPQAAVAASDPSGPVAFATPAGFTAASPEELANAAAAAEAAAAADAAPAEAAAIDAAAVAAATAAAIGAEAAAAPAAQPASAAAPGTEAANPREAVPAAFSARIPVHIAPTISGEAYALGIEGGISLAQYRSLEDAFANERLSVRMVETDDLVLSLRAVKDQAEIARMRVAQAITDAAFSHIIRFIQPGMTERDVQIELESFMMRNGAEGLAFPSIVACGPNGASPHAIPGSTVLEAGQCVVLDFGARSFGYCSDMTRTVFLGQPSEQMRTAYQAIRAANERVEAALRPGVTGRAMQELAESVLAEAGFGGTMGHGLGHGVGIDIHELPVLSTRNEEPLVMGNVVTVEPGIYISGQFGMRLEDFGVITQNGFEVFTQSTHDMVVL